MNITCKLCGGRPIEEFHDVGNIESFRSDIPGGELHGRQVMRHNCGELVGWMWTRTSDIEGYDGHRIPGPDEYLGEYVHCGHDGYLYRRGGKLVWKQERDDKKSMTADEFLAKWKWVLVAADDADFWGPGRGTKADFFKDFDDMVEPLRAMEREKRQKALSKLTDEDRRVLGLR